MIRIDFKIYLLPILFVCFLMGCRGIQEKRRENNVIVSEFIESLQENDFSKAYSYFHTNVKRQWIQQGVVVFNFEEHVEETSFDLPDQFIKRLMNEYSKEAKASDAWDRYLYKHIMLLAIKQNALLIDCRNFAEEPESIETIKDGKIFVNSCDSQNQRNSLIYTVEENGEYWVVGVARIKANETNYWPKSTMKIMNKICRDI